MGGLQQRAVTGSMQNVVGSQRATACGMSDGASAAKTTLVEWMGEARFFAADSRRPVQSSKPAGRQTGHPPSDDLQKA